MPSAPVADQLRLLDVQALDTRAAQIAHQRAQHPARAALASASARIEELQDELAAAQTAVGDARRELTKAEADVEQVRARARRDQARLDSGAVGAKDAQALVSELASLARRQSALEDAELEVMERVEMLETVLAGVEGTHERALAERDAAAAELAEAERRLDAEAAALAQERAGAVDGLDEGLVALYERLRGQLGGLGVAPLRGRRCEGCRLELNPVDLGRITAAPPEQVVRCEECGRILVRGADAEG